MPLLEYPLTRPVVLSRWVSVAIIAACILWIVGTTLLSVATAGYEIITVSTTNYNETLKNWYDILNRENLVGPATWNCSPSVIKVNESISPLYAYIEH